MTSPAEPKEGIEFDSLPWNLNLPNEISYIHVTTKDEWSTEHYDLSSDSGSLLESVHRYSETSLPVYPSTTSLNYGTTIWEGLKCFRKKDGSPVVFRPDRNFERFCSGAEQMCLPKPTRELFMRGVQLAVQQNANMVPPVGDGMKLYIRPMLLGSGQQLGLYPSPQFSLLFFVSPTVRHFSIWYFFCFFYHFLFAHGGKKLIDNIHALNHWNNFVWYVSFVDFFLVFVMINYHCTTYFLGKLFQERDWWIEHSFRNASF